MYNYRHFLLLLLLLCCSEGFGANKAIVYLKLENGKYAPAGADETGIYRMTGVELTESQIPHSGSIRGPRIFSADNLEGRKVFEEYVPDLLYIRQGNEITVGVWMDDFLLVFDDLDPKSLSNLPKELVIDHTGDMDLLRKRKEKIGTPYSLLRL